MKIQHKRTTGTHFEKVLGKFISEHPQHKARRNISKGLYDAAQKFIKTRTNQAKIH